MAFLANHFLQALHLKFEVQPSPLGEGDSGTVYKVKCSDGNWYALKVAKNGSQALKKEYDNANMIPHHDNLIKYLEIISDVRTQPNYCDSDAMEIDDAPSPSHNTTMYAVLLEWAQGKSLKNARLTESQACLFARDVLEGLKHIHDNEFMHLDIKPDNIFLITEHGPAVIGDFGQLVAYRSYQAHGTSEGDSKYMAPELLGDDRPPVHAPDIFSLGITLLDCMTNLDIPGNNQPAYEDLRNERYPEEFMSTLSEPFQAIIRRMLKRDPTQRPTASELLADPLFSQLPPPMSRDSRNKRKGRSTSSPSTPLIDVVRTPGSHPVMMATSAPNSEASFIWRQSHHRFSSLEDNNPVCRTLFGGDSNQ